MAKTIERLIALDSDGVLTVDDRPLAIEVAERIAGKRLDRRKNYAVFRTSNVAEVRVATKWTRACTGCEGGGCHECGYSGKVREGMWVPLESVTP